MTVHGPLGATEAGAFEFRDSRLHTSSGSSRTRVGMLGLSGLLGTGLVVSISAAGTDSLLPESVRPVPQWLAGPFGATGLGLSVGVLVGVMTLMFISYAAAVHAADRLSARSVLMCIAALHALVLLAPPLVSTDVFSYQAYARMGSIYGANPYLHGPSAIGLDPVLLANRPPGPPDEAAVAFVRPMVEKASLALCVNEAWAMLACVAIAGVLLVPFARDRPDTKDS